MRILGRAILIIWTWMVYSVCGFSQSLEDVLPAIPVIQAQNDGVYYLNVESAAIIKRNGKQAAIVNGGDGFLKVENGCITRWAGENEQPVWRLNITTGGLYRVVINRATRPGREGTGSINISGRKRAGLNRYIESTGGSEIYKPFEMGDVSLEPGEYCVEFRITGGTSPFESSCLADIRFIPVEPLRQTFRGCSDAVRRLDIDKDPEVAVMIEKVNAIKKTLDFLNTETRRRDFSSFTNFNQFLEYDLSPERLAVVDGEFRAASRQMDELRLSKAMASADKLKLDEKMRLDEYAGAVAALKEAETNIYPKIVFQYRNSRKERETLFPTGRLDELPKQQINTEQPMIKLTVQPPVDAAERRKRFELRNNSAGTADLCRELQKAIIPGTAGLQIFERLYKEGKYRDALIAYRTYFFDKLANPEKYGALNDNIRFELTRDRGKGHLLYYPNPVVLEKNLNKNAVIMVRNETVECEVGNPGVVSWVPHGLTLPDGLKLVRGLGNDPFWRTDEGKTAARALEFYRCLTVLPSDRGEYMSGGLFPALFFSYTVTGNKEHLSRWCEYVDDWCMNATQDMDDFPYNIRNVTELEPQQVRATLTFLRIVLDERPELAKDFDAATMARFVLKLTTDYAPYYIRARRAEMANWGIMAMCHQLHLGRFFPEFKVMDYFNRETWRLWGANMIQHQTLDGENFEAWDDGHNYVNIGFALDSLPFARFADGIDELFLESLWDHVRVDERSKLVHVSPGGNYWPYWEAKQSASRNTIKARCRQVDVLNRYYVDLIDAEPGAKNRLETIMGNGKPTDAILPDRFSDVSPYAGMYYMRDSWEPDADFLILQNFRERSQGQDDCSRTMYTLSKSDRILVEAHGLVVDRKPDNRYYGKIVTGGKTGFCGQAGRNVDGSRFHTSSRFDFAEARQDAPYARHRLSFRDVYGLYKQTAENDDPDAVMDVTVWRSVYGVRGEGLWITCDRIENKGGKEREYTQFFTFPVRISEAGFADRVRILSNSGIPLIEENEKEQRIRTGNPGFDNVSLYCFAAAPLKFANILNSKLEHDVLKKTELETVMAALNAGRTPSQILRNPLLHPVSVRWNGSGDQVFVTAHYTRPAAFSPAELYGNDLREIKELMGENGVAGCCAVTRTGAEVWFQSGTELLNKLNCGPITAEAESLLVIKSGGIYGLVLGCKSMLVNGKPIKCPDPDFEFSLDSFESSTRYRSFDSVQPILRPIDTVVILPKQNIFTDRLHISFDIPTHSTDDIELRYTLDGSEPLLESKLYSGPFSIDKSTVVKVRPFRKGLRETPWHFTGTECGKTISAIFRKKELMPAQKAVKPAPGFRYDYFEGNWLTLFSYAGFDGVLESESSGSSAVPMEAELLESIRKTDRAYAVRYDGLVNIPKSGVYSFYAPVHLYTSTMDAGYDLRVFIDGEEWLPNPALHCENIWCVALAEGFHRLQISFVDYRWKKFRNEYWMVWQEEEMWSGVPVIEVSGPSLEKQTMPLAWFKW